MLNSKIEESIIEASVEDIVKLININPNLIYPHINSLENRLKRLEFNSSGDDIAKFFNVLFLNKDKIEEPDYRLIKQISYNQLSIGGLSKTVIDTMPYLSIIGLFYDIGDIISNESIMDNYIQQIYVDIVDLYIPCDNPNLLVNLFMEEFSLREILSNISSEWFYNKYNSSDDLKNSFMIKEMLLLDRYIIDILSNDESRFNHIKKLQEYYKKTYRYREKFNEIADRYEKYFKEDTRFIMAELIDIILSNDLDNSTHTFLIEWSSKYHVRANSSVVNCLINDVGYLVNIISAEDKKYLSTVNNVSQIIIDKWGTPLYEVEPDFDSLEMLNDDDKPISYLTSIATEAVHKDSPVINNAEKKIYKAYKNYKEAEEKVDSQITKAMNGIKGVLTGDVRTEVIEGKKFSAIGLLKQLLGTVAIFSTNKIAGVIALVTKYALKKKTTQSERRKIIMELETEIELITEKIEDAKSDGNREAKYAMMRTKKDLEHALNRINYGMEADGVATRNAKQILDESRGGR